MAELTPNQTSSQMSANIQQGSVVGSAKLAPTQAKAPTPTVAYDIKNINDAITNITRRIKLIEERSVALKSKTTMLEDNEMTEKRHVDKEVKELSNNIKEVKLSIAQIKDDVLLIIKELQTLAKKDKVDMLDKYIELWSPINYVSQNEVQKIVKDLIEEALKDMNLKMQEEKYVDDVIDRKLKERGM
jgi:hypothetical protein